MYITFLITFKFEFLIGACISKNLNLIFNNENEPRLEKFKLNKNEIQQFRDSLDRMTKINNNMMEHIKNLKYAKEQNNFCKYSLPSLAEYINKIAISRKNAENKTVGEYEFLKFCELYYRTLFHIIKYNEIPYSDFFELSLNQILPFLNQIKYELNRHKFCNFNYLLVSKVNVTKKNDEDRRKSLLYFVIKFLENQKIIFSNDQINLNHNIDELISLSANIFSRFFLCRCSNSEKFYMKFKQQKYTLSAQFVHFLFASGIFAAISYDGRLIIRRFLREKNNNLEALFLEQRIIPPLSDVINRHSAIFGLDAIGYSRDNRF